MMACTTSIGPGALNMITAAGVAHVNRLPVLLLPGDVFANRRPDPVLQQVESFGDGTVSANDAFRPLSRFFDRITRPEQLLTALPRALAVLTDPAECGPVTLSLCQDMQTEAFDWPDSFFETQMRQARRAPPDADELAAAAALFARAERPLIVAGGGVLYSGAEAAMAAFAESHGAPVVETQAGKGALAWDHPCNAGAVGVTGSSAANALLREADCVLAIGARLADFTTGSRALLPGGARLIQLNVAAFDAGKHGATPLVGDARVTIEALARAAAPRDRVAWRGRARDLTAEWTAAAERAVHPRNGPLPSDAEVLGVVNAVARAEDVVVCAAGGLPGELHKLWRTQRPGGYHLEYGFSCMGYEIAGALGVRLARPDGEVFVLVGDGSYLMMNSEIQTSVMMGKKLIVTVLDNGGFGCIDRLQRATGGASFNNLLATVHGRATAGEVNFAAHARSLGAAAETVASLADLRAALERARASDRTSVVVIETDPGATTEAGGAWWDVAVPEVSPDPGVQAARVTYSAALKKAGR